MNEPKMKIVNLDEGQDMVIAGVDIWEDDDDRASRINIEVWIPNVDSYSETRRLAKEKALELMARAIRDLS